MAKKIVDPVDVEVGRRIRLYRIDAGLSQTKLAERIGVTFQQVQKYEKGANRVGAGRLTQIATVLKVPITSFFKAMHASDDGKEPAFPTALLTTPHALKLLKAYSTIPDDGDRRAIVRLVESISEYRCGSN